MSRHPCPVPGCDTRIASGLLMCPPHWLAVPRSLRQDINRAWRAFNRAMNGTREESSQALQRYQAAADAAVATVTRAEAPVCD